MDLYELNMLLCYLLLHKWITFQFFSIFHYAQFFVYKSGTENFSKHVEPKCLPIEYGGNHYTLNELRGMLCVWNLLHTFTSSKATWKISIFYYLLSFSDICYQNLLRNREWFTKANHEIENMRYQNLGEWQTTFERNGTFKFLQLD